MGKRYRTLISGPALFFTTTSTLNRLNAFTDEKTLEIVQNELYRTIELKSGHLMGFVIMPNHVHLLIGFVNGGIILSDFIHSFKGAVRKRLAGDSLFWERGFDDLEIKTLEQFVIKLDYIHNNSVRRGLVDSPDKWDYSSYRFWELNDVNPYLVKDFGWMGINVIEQ